MRLRLLVLLLLTFSAQAREVVFLQDGSRGVVLERSQDTVLVGLTKLRRIAHAALDQPQAQEVPASSLRSAHLQAEGLAVLIDPRPPTNLRSSPNGPVVARLDGHSALIVLKRGEWHQVMTGSGSTGYVHASTVSILSLDYPKDQIDAICAPLAAHHKQFCSKNPTSDGRKKMFLSVSFGPLGRVVFDTHGQLVLRETSSTDLSEGFTPDGQWLAAGEKLVNYTPPYSADYPESKLLYRKVGASYHLVMAPDFYSLEILKSKGVPDSVIRALCLYYPKK